MPLHPLKLVLLLTLFAALPPVFAEDKPPSNGGGTEVRDALRQAQRQVEDARKLAHEKMKQAREQAQQQMQEARKQMDIAMKHYREAARLQRYSGAYSRLGIVLKPDSGSPGARGGVVNAVTPGSAADNAGLKAGDVLVAIDGTQVSNAPDGGSEDGWLSKSLHAVHKLKPGDKVTVDYRRGSENRRAELTVEPRRGRTWDVSVDDRHGRFRWNEGPDHLFDMELVAINPELGQYFGTTQGLLVVRATADGDSKLKAGDVIVKIGDEPASSPTHAVRLFRSYEPGHEIPIEIFRQKTKQNIVIHSPGIEPKP